MANFGGCEFTCDREATVAAYAEVKAGGADQCKCDPCANYVQLRSELFPKKFIEFLEFLGIDFTKEAEAYHLGKISPGRHLYGGWFHFIGTIDNDSSNYVDFGNGFSAYLIKSSAPGHWSVLRRPSVQLEFQLEGVRWVLGKPEPD